MNLALKFAELRLFEDHAAWLSWLHELLPEPVLATDAPVAIDLFAGCGGLALGFECQGFRTAGYECKEVAVATYNLNLGGRCHQTFLEVGMPEGEADIIIGGPPCQPFSQIGYQRGKRDPRDGFPVFLDAVNRIRPKIAIIENVRGLLYRNKDYLRQTKSELERFGYTVFTDILKAVKFGVPQNRERVVVVATQIGWQWPEPLVDKPVSVGVALGPMAKAFDLESKLLTENMDRYIAEYEKKSHCINPRDLHLDKPSRTVTCRNLGGATADMLRIKLDDGRRRMLTVREGARLQCFPDWFQFTGTEYERYEQIGNAVPPLMALALAQKSMELLNRLAKSKGEIIMSDDSGRKSSENHLLDQDQIKIKIEQAINILKSIGVNVRKLTGRRRERVAKALLAVAYLVPTNNWYEADSCLVGGRPPVTTRQVIRFWNEHYGENIADSSYDDVRRKDLIILVDAGLVAKSAAKPSADINDGTRGYALEPDALNLLRSYGSERWEEQLLIFRAKLNPGDRLSKAPAYKRVSVKLPTGEEYHLSPGAHNRLQKAIIEEFLERFSPGAEILYVGDAEEKMLHVEKERLKELGIESLSRKTLPDVVAYDAERNWIFLIEAVHSFNPINELRHKALARLVSTSKASPVFVTVFESMKKFASFAKDIDWETEVWIAEEPDHLIHYNGDRFLGPH